MAQFLQRRLFSRPICSTCRTILLVPRSFSTTSSLTFPEPPRSSIVDSMANLSSPGDSMADMLEILGGINSTSRMAQKEPDPHRLHVYSTKHNTHITLSAPSPSSNDTTTKDPSPRTLISLSAGNIGFRKGQRGKYDAAYQLAAYVLKAVKDRGLLRQIKKLEVVLRGFGQGREAVTKAILGSEGKDVRGLIISVKDATRLKFGGTRSPNPRRLG